MKTSFLGQAYASRSPILSSQTAINIFPELSESGGSEIGGFYGTPGRQSVFQGAGEVRGLWVTTGGIPGLYRLFAVIGSSVYRLDSNYNATNLGTLPNVSGRVSMVDNGTQLAIAHQDGMHWVSLTGSTIASVTNAPSGAVLSALDNYVLFTQNVGGEFGITALGDLSSIDPLDVATAEGWPDDCVSCVVTQREAALLGTDSIEVWSDTGASLFPLERTPGGFIEQGCAAKWSPVKLDNSVFWLGRDRNGRGIAYRSNGYTPVRISTHPLESEWNSYDDISDAIGFSYQEEGHAFYQITFPTGNATWVYDVATKMWHQRAYMDAFGLLNRDRANCYAFFNDDHLVGDYQNGKIYRMRMDLTTDDGTPIYRERAWDFPDTGEDEIEHRKIRIDLLEVLALTGDGDGAGGAPQVWLQISKDAGRTWGFQRYQKLGKVGERKARARWRRLGYGRDIAARIATNMTQQVQWVGAFWDGEVLTK